ncbi:hypothetical protein Fot_38920 [Forsythia ovata]|uniref:Uncharacterized protein n=1 Tax=Forsythia ovata TaxID=205694 RepID=A0ABD1S3Y5_9LAMI
MGHDTNSGSRRKWWVTAEMAFSQCEQGGFSARSSAQMVGHSAKEAPQRRKPHSARGLSTKEAPQRESAALWRWWSLAMAFTGGGDGVGIFRARFGEKIVGERRDGQIDTLS